MKKFLLSSFASLVILTGVASPANASLVITLSSGEHLTNAGAPVALGTLFQLVNLGNDGIFNQINVFDSNTDGLNRWVSGDDTVMDLMSIGNDISNMSSFDLRQGNDTVPGVLSRVFEFATAAFPKGINIGIRWFPGIQADQFAQTILQEGQSYGQFTRSTPKYGLSPWNVTADDGNITFDPLATASQGGTDGTGLTDESRAHFQVVPEPTAIGMSLIGAAGLAMLRRRRA
jgi:hypothetical protein